MKLSILIPVRAKLLYPFRYETPCNIKIWYFVSKTILSYQLLWGTIGTFLIPFRYFPYQCLALFENFEFPIPYLCVTIVCRNDELSSTMSWVGCLLPDSELFILFAENSQILHKISVISDFLRSTHNLKKIFLTVSK